MRSALLFNCLWLPFTCSLITRNESDENVVKILHSRVDRTIECGQNGPQRPPHQSTHGLASNLLKTLIRASDQVPPNARIFFTNDGRIGEASQKRTRDTMTGGLIWVNRLPILLEAQYFEIEIIAAGSWLRSADVYRLSYDAMEVALETLINHCGERNGRIPIGKFTSPDNPQYHVRIGPREGSGPSRSAPVPDPIVHQDRPSGPRQDFTSKPANWLQGSHGYVASSQEVTRMRSELAVSSQGLPKCNSRFASFPNAETRRSVVELYTLLLEKLQEIQPPRMMPKISWSHQGYGLSTNAEIEPRRALKMLRSLMIICVTNPGYAPQEEIKFFGGTAKYRNLEMRIYFDPVTEAGTS